MCVCVGVCYELLLLLQLLLLMVVILLSISIVVDDDDDDEDDGGDVAKQFDSITGATATAAGGGVCVSFTSSESSTYLAKSDISLF